MKGRNLIIALVAVGALVAYQKITPRHVVEHHTIERHVEEVTSNYNRPSTSGADVMIDRRFDVSSGDELLVDIEHSDLIISSGDNGVARVRVELEADNMDRGREFYESLNYRVEQTRAGVQIRADRERNYRWNWNSDGDIDITVYVTVPTEFDLDIQASHGDVRMDRARGSSSIYMSHGDLVLDELEGDRIDIKLSHGDFDGGELSGARVALQSSHGDISLRSISSPSIDAQLAHGDIQVESVTGAIRVDNSHGDIDVGLAELDGGRFTNSHGDINLVASSRVSANVDFSGDRVRVSSDLSFDGSIESDRAEGRVNGGGGDLVARTNHGSIHLRDR